MTDPMVARARAARARPTPAAKAGRLMVTGAAVGAGLAMVGIMSAAARSGEQVTSPPAVHRVVVVPREVSRPEPVVATPRPTAPVVAESAPRPVTESSGS